MKDGFIKLYLESVKDIYNTEFSLYFDGEFCKLHVLDLDKEGRRTLTNASCAAFFVEVDRAIFSYVQSYEPQPYDIYLYHTDGMITEYQPGAGGGFMHVSPQDAHLYEPFKRISAERWEALA